ncbi:putative lipoprotein [Buttiauxella ferragutiae ATCC 51602]|uniref:Lipoprotein n=1 Tax=Buttiauxella ferragutiae ATCC 51602 TaxID=1354252 RepID=A0ABX2WC73_9ENTR|nr:MULTISPECIES: DUF3829 domain-containing protein [Buttiauxella]AYN28320.1 DUF3829 domain-containing protein [Buttiauxella sp. 3AFRM03]OAT30591.1 putative lipoprotein [Buttiauxella ferragutiae ATCC 51602]UNK61454.1 YiiG family protein [Buttiauxella ferragutiae]
MYLRKECFHKKTSKILISTIFAGLLISGCDDKQPKASESASAEQADTRHALCSDLPKIPGTIQNGDFPYWSDNLAESDIKNYLNTLSDIEKNQGKTLIYYSLALIIHASKATQIVSKDTFIPEEAQLQLVQLNSLISAAQECYKAAPSSNNSSLIRYSFLLDAADQYDKLLAERIQRHQNSVPYTEGEKGQIGGVTEWMVKGSVGRVTRSYNNVVSSFNELH